MLIPFGYHHDFLVDVVCIFSLINAAMIVKIKTKCDRLYYSKVLCVGLHEKARCDN